MGDFLNKIIYRKFKVKHLLLLLILLLLLLLTRCGEEEPETDETAAAGVVFDPNAGAYEETESSAGDESSQGVAIPGWGTLNFPAGKTEVTVDFYNPEENEGLYYLTYELRLPDDSEQGYEILYTSGLIKPGDHIQKITLSHSLEAGTYEAVVHVQPYRMDDAQTPTNNADMNTTLEVS